MGIPVEKIQSSVRISWGPGVNKDNIYKSFLELLKIVKSLEI